MDRFEDIAKSRSRPTILSDLVHFFRHEKKWWMAPLIVLLLLFGALMLLSVTAVSPFIYTLF
jgi:hypothetical protein